MRDGTDHTGQIQEQDQPSFKGPSRRAMLFAGGASVTAAAVTSGQGAAWAQSTDNVKRIQPREGFTIPFPKNWIADHTNDDLHTPINELPTPLTANVNADDPLEIDLFLSMKSATGYLMLDRLLALSANYNVKLNFRPILPREVLTGEEGEFPYTFNYNRVEYRRLAEMYGIPFEYPKPQVVVQDVWPPLTRTLDAPIGEENQKNAYYVSRMAAAAALQYKGDVFLDSVFRMIWNGSTDDWPNQVVSALEKAGLDGKAMHDDVKAKPEMYDALLMKNLRAQTRTGHEGSAVTAFRQEPFPGQNRFDELFWTLLQSGLTRKPGGAALQTSSWIG